MPTARYWPSVELATAFGKWPVEYAPREARSVVAKPATEVWEPAAA